MKPKNQHIIWILVVIILVVLGFYLLWSQKESFTGIPNSWDFPDSKDWYTIKKNGFSMKLSDMKFSQYKNISYSFLLKVRNGSSNWRNIYHVTNGGACCNPGDRAPAVWIFPDNNANPRLHIRYSTDRDGNDGYDSDTFPLFQPIFVTLLFVDNTFRCYLNGMMVK